MTFFTYSILLSLLKSWILFLLPYIAMYDHYSCWLLCEEMWAHLRDLQFANKNQFLLAFWQLSKLSKGSILSPPVWMVQVYYMHWCHKVCQKGTILSFPTKNATPCLQTALSSPFPTPQNTPMPAGQEGSCTGSRGELKLGCYSPK